MYSAIYSSLTYMVIFVSSIMCIFDIHITVPTPNVSVTAPNTQTVGQSLTLQCEVTTVRGIISRVDIVWSSDIDVTVLRRIDDTAATTTDNSLVYTDSYTISQLSTDDEDRVIRCEVVINANPVVMTSDSITLDVTGECGKAIANYGVCMYATYVNCFNIAKQSSVQLCH